MIVSGLGTRSEAGVARVEAHVEWEQADTPPLALFIETEERLGEALVPDPNALLIACLLPAWRAGEQRVRIEGTLCPLLRERLRTPVGMLRSWFPQDFGPPPTVEGVDGFELREPVVGRSVALLSCGIDSLATLRWNVLHVPRRQPDAIEACAYFAIDDAWQPSLERLRELTGPRSAAVTSVTRDAGVEAIPIRTNMWWLVDDGYFYTYKWHGAFLAALLSVFGGRFSKGYIASSHSPPVMPMWGSHPLLDPYYSSAHFRIEHDLFGRSRSEKAALVSQWPAGLANLRVCQNDDSGGGNCGTCEKCIRTQIQLAGMGTLDAAAASFPHGELTPELVETIATYDMISDSSYLPAWYEEFVPQLRGRGYHELAASLEAVLRSAVR